MSDHPGYVLTNVRETTTEVEQVRWVTLPDGRVVRSQISQKAYELAVSSIGHTR